MEMSTPHEAALLAIRAKREAPKELVGEPHIPGLSWYDLYREPLAVVRDQTVKLPQKDLNEELTCAICMGIMKSTRATNKECVHRFCQECIESSLRVLKKCPTCRAEVPSRRNLRPDANFDRLISELYPDLEEIKRAEEKVIEKITSAFDRDTLRKQVEEGLARQTQAVRKDMYRRRHTTDQMLNSVRRRKSGEAEAGGAPPKRRRSSGSNSNARANAEQSFPLSSATRNATNSIPPHLRIVFLRAHNEKALKKLAYPVLVVPCHAPVSLLQQILLKYATIPGETLREEDIVIVVQPPLRGDDESGKLQVVKTSDTIGAVYKELWRTSEKQFTLQYLTRKLLLGSGNADTPATLSGMHNSPIPAGSLV